MRVRTVGFLSALLLLLTAFSAYGASLSYQPDKVSITVEPGEASPPLKLVVQTDVTRKMSAYVTFAKEVTGDLQKNWLSTSGGARRLKLVDGVYRAVAEVVVHVPRGTPSGTYSGRLISEGTGSLGNIDGGEGVLFTVRVVQGCSSVPVLSNVTVGPEIIWTSKNKDVEVKDVEVMITGMLSMSEGCRNMAAYHLIDEYGKKYVPETAIDLNEDGSFSLPVSVEAYSEGSDEDGRVYTITLIAENEAGEAEDVELYVRVGHDMGKNK